MALPYLYAYNRSTRVPKVPQKKKNMRESTGGKAQRRNQWQIARKSRFFSPFIHSIGELSSKNYTRNRIDLFR